MSKFESIIQEITLNDLKKDFKGSSRPHAGLVDRSKKVDVRLEKIDSDGTMHWSAKAVTTDGVSRWKQEIVLKDWQDALEMDDLSFQERANLAIFGDLDVNCNDPSFLFWGYKYIATQLDYIEGDKENRAPVIRNPKEEGVVCKHLIAVLQALPFHINDIAKKMKEMKKESVGGYKMSKMEILIEKMLEAGGDGTGPPGGVGRGLGPGGGRGDGSGLGKGRNRPLGRGLGMGYGNGRRVLANQINWDDEVDDRLDR